MKKVISLVVLSLLLAGCSSQSADKNSQLSPSSFLQGKVSSTPCVPTFADGGGPYYQTGSPMREKIVPDKNTGIRLIVSGKVLRSDCSTPIAGAILDLWQANESGSYQDEWYRGKVTASQDGSYRFETIVPKGYGEGTGYRPPHIHFKVVENERVLITSQMFFPDAVGWAEKPFILTIETKEENGEKVLYGLHDIVVP